MIGFIGFLLAVMTLNGPEAKAQVRFEDVTASAGVVAGSSSLASGSAWRDVDGDGYPDLFVGNHARMPMLFRNRGDGTFADAILEVMVKPATEGNGAWGDQHGSAFADVNNDGAPDLLVLVGAERGLGRGPKQLYISAAGRLIDVAAPLGLDYPLARGRSPAWLDYDNDGRLDVFVGAVARPDGEAPPTLFRQTDAGFVDVRDATGFQPLTTLGIWLADLDRDGRLEILFRGRLAAPRGVGTSRLRVIDTTTLPFRDVTPFPFRGLFPDLAIADFDGDLRPDLFVANSWTRTAYGHNLYLNRASGWIDATAVANVNAIDRPSRPGTIAADFDNDMDVDIFVDGGRANGADLPNIMLWNRGDGTFTAEDNAGGARGLLQGWPDTVTAADYDVDGFVDLYITYNKAATQLYRNLGNGNAWLAIDLVGTRSNRDGIGAQVTVTTPDGRTQLREQGGGIHRYWGQNDQRLHVGLGANAIASEVRVDWPSGARSVLADVEVRQVLTITEPPADPVSGLAPVSAPR
jgi:hypothetical protein